MNAAKPCRQCGTMMDASYQQKKFCSRKCRVAGQRLRAKADGRCSVCFKNKVSEGLTTCDQCRAVASKSKKKYQPPGEIECQSCRKIFMQARIDQKFCSAECREKERIIRKQEREKLELQNPNGKECSICKNTFISHKKTQIYCSKTCARRAEVLRKRENRGVYDHSDIPELPRREVKGDTIIIRGDMNDFQGSSEKDESNCDQTRWVCGHLMAWKSDSPPIMGGEANVRDLHRRGVSIKSQVSQWRMVTNKKVHVKILEGLR